MGLPEDNLDFGFQALVNQFDSLKVDGAAKVLGAAGVGSLTWLVGGIDQLLISLYVVMVLDFVLGFLRGWLASSLSSPKLARGVVKFVFYTSGIALAVVLDRQLGTYSYFKFFQDHGGVRQFLASYLLVCESISVLEHLSAFGVPIPNVLLSKLSYFRDKIMEREASHAAQESPELIVRFSKDGTVSFANKSALDFFSFPAMSLLKKKFWELMATTEQPRVKECIDCLVTKETCSVTIVAINDAGDLRAIHWLMKVSKDPSGQVIGYQANGRDVTDTCPDLIDACMMRLGGSDTRKQTSCANKE